MSTHRDSHDSINPPGASGASLDQEDDDISREEKDDEIARLRRAYHEAIRGNQKKSSKINT